MCSRSVLITSTDLTKFGGEPLGKYIFIPETIDEEVASKYKVIQDAIQWADLSFEYQEELLAQNWEGFRLRHETKREMLRVKECLWEALDNIKVTSKQLCTKGEEVVASLGLSSADKEQLVQDTLSLLLREFNSDLLGRNEPEINCAGWYFVAELLLKGEYSHDDRYIRRALSTQSVLCPVDGLTGIETYAFKNDLLVLFMDWMLGVGERHDFHLPDELVSQCFEAMLYSTANNLVHIVSQRQRGDFVRLIRPVCPPPCKIIHLLVPDSINYAGDILEDRKKISALIENGYYDVNELATECNLTPVLLPRVHVELVKNLVTLGADVTAKTKFESTCARNAYYLPSDQIKEFIRYFVEKGLANIAFVAWCLKSCNPLDPEKSSLEAIEDSLDMFIRAGFDLNQIVEDGQIAWFLAIVFGTSVELLKAFVERGADCQLKNDKGLSALHLACMINNLGAITYFVNLGCDVNVRDNYGDTPFDKLLRAGHQDALFDDAVHLFLTYMPNAVHLLAQDTISLYEEKVDYRIKLISYECSRNKYLLNERIDEQNLTPLLMPNVHVDVIKHLMQLGADITASDSNGFTFAHMASCYLPLNQFQEFVRHLEEKGILKETFSARDNHGRTPLQAAVTRLELDGDTLGLIVSARVDINVCDIVGNNVLFQAIISGRSVRLLSSLMERGADWSIRNKKGYNVLHIAAESGNMSALKHFLDLGSDENSRDNLLLTPLDLGCDLIATTAHGSTFAHLAASKLPINQFDELVYFLKERDQLRDVFNSRDNTNQTPLHPLLMRPYIYTSTIELLASTGIDMEAEDHRGYTPFLVAASNAKVDILKVLVKCGANWSHRTKDQSNALQLAVESECINLELLEYLAELDCDAKENSAVRNLLGVLKLRKAYVYARQALESLLKHTTSKCSMT